MSYFQYCFLYFKKYLSIGFKIFIVLTTLYTITYLFAFFSSGNKLNNISNKEITRLQRQEIYKSLNSLENNKTESGKMQTLAYKNFYCSLIGEACTNNPDDANKNFKNSTLGGLTYLFTLPYANPPASGVYYAYTKINDAGFIPKTYAAQGIGYSSMQHFMNIWKMFRDLTYFLLIIVFILIGFLIMFRVKLNPQTVIGIENTLPKIIITLILITFSYAIVGFLIDLMYVIMAIVINLFKTNAYIDINGTSYFKDFIAGNPFTLMARIWSDVQMTNIIESLIELLPSTLGIVLRVVLGAVVYWFINKIPLVGDIVSGKVLQNVIETGRVAEFIVKAIFIVFFLSFFSLIVPYILVFFIAITLLIVFFRILFLLLKSYLTILLFTVFSPIILLFEAIPGKSVFSYWFKTIFVNLLVFPFTVFIFIFSYIIVQSSFLVDQNAASVWKPPFLFSMNGTAFIQLVGCMILFMTPDLIKMFKQLLGAKDGPLGFSPGILFAGAGVGVGSGIGLINQYSSLRTALFGYSPKGILGGGTGAIATGLKKIFGVKDTTAPQ